MAPGPFFVRIGSGRDRLRAGPPRCLIVAMRGAGMDCRELVAAPLAVEAFLPFGRVVEPGGGPGRAVNAGTALRFDLTGHFAHRTMAVLPALAVYRCQPQPQPVAVTMLERHPLSSQTFIPVATARWLVVVAPIGPDGGPLPACARAFLASAGQGVSYAPGVWHSPLIALDRPADFVMLMWEVGAAEDCEARTLPDPLRISLPASGWPAAGDAGVSLCPAHA
jgi:ureidoglycolate lyase